MLTPVTTVFPEALLPLLRAALNSATHPESDKESRGLAQPVAFHPVQSVTQEARQFPYLSMGLHHTDVLPHVGYEEPVQPDPNPT